MILDTKYILHDQHARWFCNQIKVIEGMKMKPSLTAYSNRFQLFHLKDLPVDGNSINIEDKGLGMNLKVPSESPKISSAPETKSIGSGTLRTQSKSNSTINSKNRRVTFAVKMSFPKGTYTIITYRLMDLKNRKEWDSNFDNGHVVQEFELQLIPTVKNEVIAEAHLQAHNNNRTSTSQSNETLPSEKMDPPILKTTLSTLKTIPSSFNSNEGLNFYQNDFFYHDLIYMRMRSPTKLVKDRDTLLYRYSHKENGRFISLMQTYDDEENILNVKNLPPPNPRTVRAQTRFHGYLVEDREDFVEVSMISDHYIGNIPQFIVSMLFDKKSLEWYKQFSMAIGTPVSKI